MFNQDSSGHSVTLTSITFIIASSIQTLHPSGTGSKRVDGMHQPGNWINPTSCSENWPHIRHVFDTLPAALTPPDLSPAHGAGNGFVASEWVKVLTETVRLREEEGDYTQVSVRAPWRASPSPFEIQRRLSHWLGHKWHRGSRRFTLTPQSCASCTSLSTLCADIWESNHHLWSNSHSPLMLKG